MSVYKPDEKRRKLESHRI